MTDENADTSDFQTTEVFDRILAKLDGLDARLAAIEADRTRETRPRLDTIISELAELREGQRETNARLDRIERRLDVLTIDVADVRADQRRLDSRVDDLERRPN